MAWLTDITAFRLFDMTERLWFNALFLAKQIGEFDWTWFYVQSFIRFEIIHWCLIRWTPHLCKWSKHWIFPPNTGLSPQNWGRKGVGKRRLEGKTKVLHPQFCEFPAHPPHAWREMSHETNFIDFFLNAQHLRNATCITSNKSWTKFHKTRLTDGSFETCFFWRDALSSLSIIL